MVNSMVGARQKPELDTKGKVKLSQYKGSSPPGDHVQSVIKDHWIIVGLIYSGEKW